MASAGADPSASGDASAAVAAADGSRSHTPKVFQDVTHFLRSEEEVQDILDEFQSHLMERTRHHLGYPYNLRFESIQLAPFLR